MREYLHAIDRHTEGGRNDVTPLFADADALRAAAADLACPFRDARVSHVGALDALGFVLGTAVALELNAGLIPLRKGGKLPVPTHSRSFIDYSGASKTLELRIGAVAPSCRALLVDDWSETGSQFEAAASLLVGAGAKVVGFAALRIDKPAATRLSRIATTHSIEPS